MNWKVDGHRVELSELSRKKIASILLEQGMKVNELAKQGAEGHLKMQKATLIMNVFNAELHRRKTGDNNKLIDAEMALHQFVWDGNPYKPPREGSIEALKKYLDKEGVEV